MVLTLHLRKKTSEETQALNTGDSADEEMNLSLSQKQFGNSTVLIDSIPVAEFQGRPLADHPSVKNGRRPGALITPSKHIDASTLNEALSVFSCWYEDKTEWGKRVGWIYGSITKDVLTGYRMEISLLFDITRCLPRNCSDQSR
jgi:cellulose synthase-like protein